MKRWPVYVMSKGRSDSLFLKRLNDCDDRNATVVVEPQECGDYTAAFPNLKVLVLPENDRGVYYGRREVLNLMAGQGGGWFWLLDDDIKSFNRVEGKKNVPCSMDEALLAAQEAGAVCGIRQVSLEYSQFAWSRGGKPSMNSYADVVVGIDSSIVNDGITYRDDFVRIGLKGDRDLAMQIIHNGFGNIRVATHSFTAPKNGSNKGGLQATYQYGDGQKSARESEAVEALVANWPWCVKRCVKRDGRVDAKIFWKRI